MTSRTKKLLALAKTNNKNMNIKHVLRSGKTITVKIKDKKPLIEKEKTRVRTSIVSANDAVTSKNDNAVGNNCSKLYANINSTAILVKDDSEENNSPRFNAEIDSTAILVKDEPEENNSPKLNAEIDSTAILVKDDPEENNSPKLNAEIDSTVKFKMGKFFESQDIELENTNKDSSLKFITLTPMSTHSLNKSSISSVYEDSGSSYKPSVHSTHSEDNVGYSNSPKSSTKIDTPSLKLSSNGSETNYPQNNEAIKAKSVMAKGAVYNITAPVENSKRSAFSNKRIWDKKDCCLFCEEQVTNFIRHLARKHAEEIEVGKLLSLKKGSNERKRMVDQLRKRGNFFNNIGGAPIIIPVRRPNQCIQQQPSAADYLPCKFCFGLFKKKYLRRHIKNCSLKKDEIGGKRQNIQANAQTLLLAFTSEDTQLVEQIFPRMAPDEISLVVKSDPLIRAFGTRYLKCHKEKHLTTVVSNKMRELGRLLMAMRNSGKNNQSLLDCLKPELFDDIVNSTKNIAGYDKISDKFRAPSLVLKIGTSLKQCCDITEYLLLKKSISLCSENSDQTIMGLKTVENLITKQWCYELATNASKELYQKKWNKPAFLPLTSDIKIFRDYLLLEQKNALSSLKKNPTDLISFKALQNTVLAQLILLNRKRAGEVQRILLKTYLNCSSEAPQEEMQLSLSEVELELTKQFKRIVIRGKRGRGVPILFTPKIQNTLSILISIRDNFCEKDNEFLFAIPNTKDSCLRASEIIRKLAIASGAKNPSAITSTKLRKQVATVAQLLNFNESDIEQLANFMGHSKEIHKSFYRLPESTFQVAKVSKFLLMMEKGEADQYKGKNFDDIDVKVDGLISDSEDSYNGDSDFSTSEEDIEICKTNTDSNDIQKNVKSQLIQKNNSLNTHLSPPKVTKTIIVKSKDLKTPKKHSADQIQTNKFKEKKFIRVPWTEKQKTLTTKYFQKHILLKIPPKKNECDEFLKKNSIIMTGKDWKKVKTFIYNTYKS